MSRVVDNRVVEMEFNNARFEKNVATTMSTIEKLKAKLDFSKSVKGLDDLEKSVSKVDVNPLGTAIDKVKDSFSALDVIAIRTLTNITDRAFAAGERLIKSLTVDQIAEAWDKYASKTSSVQTIMAATSKDFTDTGVQMEYVNSQLNKLNWYTDETSAKYLDMVNNIGKFTANNIKLETAVTAMQGIANWGYVSGANINDQARAMYNLSQAIAVGSVKLMDWKSIENANMATAEFKQTAIETAVELGTLKKVGDGVYKTLKGNTVSTKNFNNALSDAWFTSDVLLKSLDKYGEFSNRLYETSTLTGLTATELLGAIDDYRDSTLDLNAMAKDTGVSVDELKKRFEGLTDSEMALGEKAFRAAQEAKTFKEAIDAVKDAVSTSWMVSFEKIFGDYEQAKKLWSEFSSDLWDIFASGGAKRNKLLEKALGDRTNLIETSGAWNSVVDQLSSAGVGYKDLKDAITETAKAHGIAVDEMVAKDGSFVESLKEGWLTTDLLAESLAFLTTASRDANGALVANTGTIQEYKDLIDRVIKGEFGVGQDRVEKLTKAGYDYNYVQDLVNKTVWEQVIEWGELSDAELKNLGYTKEQIDAIRKLSTELKDGDSALSVLVSGFARESGRDLLIDSFRNALHGLMEVMQLVKDAWHDIFPETTAIQLYNAINKFHEFTKIFRIFYEEVEEHTGEFDDQGNEIVKTVKRLSTTGQKLTNVLRGVFAVLSIVKEIVSGAVKVAFRVLGAAFKLIAGGALDASQGVSNFFQFLSKGLREGKVISSLFDRIGDVLVGVIDRIRGFLSGIKEWTIVRKIVSGVNKILDKLFTTSDGFGKSARNLKAFADNVGKLRDKIVNAATAVGDFFKKFVQLPEIQNGLKSIEDFFVGIWNGLKNFGTGVWNFIKGVADNIKKLNFEDFASTLKGVWDSIVGIFTGGTSIKDAFGSIKSSVKDMADKVTAGLEPAGDAFTKFKDKVVTAFTWVKDKLKGLNLAAIIGGIIGVEAIKVLGNALRIVVNVSGAFKTLTNSVRDLTRGINTLSKAKLNEAKAEKWKAMTGFIVALTAMMGVILVAAATMTPDQLKTAAAILGVFAIVIIALLVVCDRISEGSADAVKAIGQAALIIAVVGILMTIGAVILKLAKVSWADGAKALTLVAGTLLIMLGFLWVLSKFESGPDAKSFKGAGKLLRSIAISLILISVALKILSGIDPENLVVAVIALSAVFVGLAALYVVIGAAGYRATKAGKSILQIAAGLLILAIVLKILADMAKKDPEGLVTGLIALGVLFAELGVLFLMTMLAGKNATKAGASVLLVGVGLLLITKVLKNIASMTSSELSRSLKALVVIGVVVALMMGIAAAVKTGDKGGAAKILAFGASVLILAISLRILGDMDTGKMLASAVALVAIIIALGAAIKMASSMSKGGLAGIIAVGVLIVALVIALAVLTSVDTEKLLAAAGSITAVILAFGAVLLAASKLGKVSVSAIVTIGILALAAGALAFFLIKLSDVKNPGALIPAAEALSLLLVAFAASVLIIGQLSDKTDISAVIATVGSMVVVAACLTEFLVALTGAPDPDALLPAAEALSLLLIAFSASVLIIGQLSDKTDIDAVIVTVASMIVVAACLTELLLNLTEAPDPTALLPASEALSLLLVAFAASVLIIGQLSDKTDVVSVLATAGTLIIIAACLTELLTNVASFPDPNALLPAAEALSLLLLAFSVSAVILAGAAAIMAPATAGLWALIGFAGVLLVAVEILGALAQSPEFVTFMESGIDLLIKFGEGIGRIVGAIVGGVIDQTLSYLPSIGGYLSDFANNAATFFSTMSNVGEAALAGTLRLAEIILALTAAALIDGIVSFFGGSIDFGKFGEQLKALAPGIAYFADTTKNVTEESVKGGAAAAELLAEMANKLPRSGGILQKVIGETDWSGFIDNMPKIATALVEFSANLGNDFSANSVEKAANAASSLAEMANKLPKEGGILQDFLGSIDMEGFIDDLPNLGKALKGFSTELGSDFSAKNVEAAANAASALAEMENKLPKEGGFLQSILGSGDMDQFMSNLPTFGQSLNEFSKAIPDVNPDTIEAAANAARTLTELSKNMPEKDSWIKGVFGGNKESMGEFGDNLYAFGNGVKRFSDATVGVTEAVVSHSKYASFAIINLVDNLEGKLAESKNGFLSFLKGTLLGSFGEKLSQFGAGVTAFFSSTRGINQDVVDNAQRSAMVLVNLSNVDDATVSGWIFTDSGSVMAVSDNLKYFGEKIGIFAGYLAQANMGTALVNSTIAATVITTLYGSTKDIPDASRLDGFGTSIKTFGINVRSYYDNVKSFAVQKLSDISDQIARLIKLVNDMAGIDEQSSRGLSNVLSDLGRSGVKGFIESVDGAVEEVVMTVNSLISRMARAIQTEKPGTVAIFTGFADAIGSETDKTISGYSDKWASSGKYLVEGLSRGIKNNKGLAQEAARIVAQSAIDSFNRSLGIHSPSKVGAESGMYFDLGIAQGLEKYSGAVEAASEGVSESAINGLNSTIAAVSDMVNDGLDGDPVITPVLDLTEIQNGVSRMGGLLGSGSYALGGSFDLAGRVSGTFAGKTSPASAVADTVAGLVGAVQQLSENQGTTTNTFYITGDNPKEIADQVAEILQIRVERAERAWA